MSNYNRVKEIDSYKNSKRIKTNQNCLLGFCFFKYYLHLRRLKIKVKKKN
jgi:hypothetical protein